MGFYAEDTLSGLTIGQAIYEVALMIAVLRWVLCLIFRVMNDRRRTESDETPAAEACCQKEYNNTLVLTTLGEIKERLPQTEETCAVCLSQLSVEDEVRELMNCYHVFHRECIERWLEHEHENHIPTCPLCRAPLLSSCCHHSSTTCVPPPQPSWAVERLLYLFGDDLLPC
ncbi:RING finger protein 24-like [Glycine soja]|uniref:Putative RING finger protein P4H10.07 n=1 Tax=Glycine soja TaxID=3848 RepID=A0A445HEP9_GLYSO|nr:RING finger protein 24-like [Glycine soja]KHN45034.1 Putative RING finger protein P4H10.07 [Glycine soja]RZB72036.1 putative RING finger protein P4H10.07 [Glycine soja]